MAGSQTGSPGATRTVRIVYEVEGVEGAVTDQDALEGALQRTGEALGEQSERVERVESALGSLSDVATQSEQVQQRLHQQIQALAGGLSGLAGIIGTESEAGALVGRMGQFASVGLQLGSIFGPGGAIAGGIAGAAIPALQSLAEHLGIVRTSQEDAIDAANGHADAIDRVGESAQTATQRLADLQRALSERAAEERLGRIARGEVRSEEEALLGAERARRLAEMGRREGGTVAEIFGGMEEEAARLEALAPSLSGGRAASRGGRRGGGGARRERDVLGELMQRAAGGSDAVGFAAGLDAADVSGRPSDFDIEAADMQRRGRAGRFGGQTQAEIRAVQLLAEKQKEAHEAQMERISQQVDAWTDAGQKIGGTVYSAFTTAISGQESFEVAMVKGFKSLAIQFGGQMVNEGIAALLTAVGNTVVNPPAAATKAAEGAGKLALGIGLGAAGAAIPVPSAPSAAPPQSRPPRLGPQSSDGGVGGSVVVNMNAPAVVTGSVAQVGRSISRTVTQAQLRYGGA